MDRYDATKSHLSGPGLWELSVKQLFIIFSVIILSCFAQADTAAASEFLKLHRAESSPGLLVDGLPKADNNIKDSIINGPLYIH